MSNSENNDKDERQSETDNISSTRPPGEADSQLQKEQGEKDEEREENEDQEAARSPDHSGDTDSIEKETSPGIPSDSPGSSGFLSTLGRIMKTGLSWIGKRFGQLRLKWKLYRLERKRDRLFENIGKKTIELDLPFDEPEIEQELNRLETEEEEIDRKIQNLEDELKTIQKEKQNAHEDYEKDLEKIKKKKEPVENKKELNSVSLDRARSRKEDLEKKRNRVDEKIKHKKGNGANGSNPEFATAGPDLGGADGSNDDLESLQKRKKQLEKDLERVRNEISELRGKRANLNDRLDSIDREIRNRKKKLKRDIRNLDARIQNKEDRIKQLEEDLDGIAQHKREYAKDLGKAMAENDQRPDELDKYFRRLTRTNRKMERTNQNLDEVLVEIEELNGMYLFLFFLFWLILFLLAGAIYVNVQ